MEGWCKGAPGNEDACYLPAGEAGKLIGQGVRQRQIAADVSQAKRIMGIERNS
jgi:hypothetical protein